MVNALIPAKEVAPPAAKPFNVWDVRTYNDYIVRNGLGALKHEMYIKVRMDYTDATKHNYWDSLRPG